MITRKIFILFVLLFSTFVQAASWNDGAAAFQRGNYATALFHFESARDAGTTGPAVHYNIGVCQYRLKRYSDAASTFRLVAGQFPKMRGLAEYNLGLAEQRLGNPEAAIAHFVAAYRASPNDREIRVLASRQLRELEPEIRAASEWTGALGLRAGYDDNITLRDTDVIPASITAETPIAELFATVNRPIGGASGFSVEGNIYAVRNFDASEFNQNEISVGVMYGWRSGDWRLQVGAQYGAGSLGGESFDRKGGAIFQAIRYLNEMSSLTFNYDYDNVKDADSRFAGIDGSRQKFQVLYRRYLGDSRQIVVRIRQDLNDRIDPNVSPDRSGLSADYRYHPDVGWGFEFGASYRTSDFGDMTVSRTENLLTASAGLTRKIFGDWRFLFEYESSNNNSTDATFDYRRNVFTLGAVRVF